jgi:hypothetical protein
MYHVQTEDGGMGNPVVLTRLFSGGVLLSSRKTSYVYLMDREDLETVIVSLMEDQHKAVIEDLRRGKSDGKE